jgi:Glycosyltransferase family 87
MRGRTISNLRTSRHRPRAPALGIAIVASLTAAIAAASAHGSPLAAGVVEGSDRWSILFLVAVGLAFALYVAAIGTLRFATGHVVMACTIAAAIQLIPLAGPLLLSRDAYTYWAYGRIVTRQDRNPYTVAPARFPNDPSTGAVAHGWRQTTSVYGPAFTVLSAGVGDLAGRSAETAALAFRLIAALAAIAATVLAAIAARRKAFAAAFIGWNPLVAVSFAGGGHNDAWMLVLILGALALVASSRHAAAGVLWILAAAVKAPAIILLMLHLLQARRALRIAAAVTAFAVASAATAKFGGAWLTTSLRLGGHEARYGLPSRLEQLGVPEAIAHALAELALAGGALWLAGQALRGRPRLALGACLLVLTSPWVLPWYATWPIALAAVEEDTGAKLLALGLTAYLLPDRIPF